MANSNTYVGGFTGGQPQVTTLNNIQAAGLTLPANTQQFINARSAGKLEILFNSNDNAIYSKNNPQLLESAGLLRSPINSPFVVNPNQGIANRTTTSRLLPVQAAARDAIRISKFLTSGPGLFFLTKQVVLQGFQPFDETKIYNPAETLIAASRLATIGILDRPKRHIDTSNVLGGILGALGVESITRALSGVFGQDAGNPSPPRSTVASEASGGVGLNTLTSLLGAGDKTDKVLAQNIRDGARGLLRGGTATEAYRGKYYSTLLSPKSATGVFAKVLDAAASFIKNNTAAGAVIPPTQPIKGLNYRADEDTYDLMLDVSRYTRFTDTFGNKSEFYDKNLNNGNISLSTTKSQTAAVRFFHKADSKNLNRLIVKSNLDNRLHSKLTTTYGITTKVGKLVLSSLSNIVEADILSYNTANILGDKVNRYGDVVKVTQDEEYSDQLLNYKTLLDNPKGFKTTYSDKNMSLVQELNKIYSDTRKKISGEGTSFKKYESSPLLGRTQQYLDFDYKIGFDYLKRVEPVRNENPNELTYNGLIRKFESTDANNRRLFPTVLGKKPSFDRFIQPTNDVDYVNSLSVLTPEEFKTKYDEKFYNLGPDLIKFFFYDIVNDKFIPFLATVKDIYENNEAAWESISYLGRADKLYYYKGFTRELNFGFKVVAHSIKELMPMWQRINYLTGLTKPSNYTSTKDGGFMIPPMIQFTIGDMYKNHFGVIKFVNIRIPDDASWELINEEYVLNKEWNFDLGKIYDTRNSLKGKVAQVPKEVDVSLGISIMEKDIPKTGRGLWGDAPVKLKTSTKDGVTTYTDDYSDTDKTWSKSIRFDNDVVTTT